jgi:SAM-dependent methyltransferase
VHPVKFIHHNKNVYNLEQKKIKVFRNIKNKIENKSTMFSVWVDLLIIIIFLLGTLNIFNNNKKLEGFENDSFEYKTGDDIYDEFYTDIYDVLVFNNGKNDYEIKSIANTTHIDHNSLILDIGCGKGHHAAELAKLAKHVTAIDTSPAMIRSCKSEYKTVKNISFKQGNALTSLLFQPNSFSQIVCLYFTIYYMADKPLFFRNCYNWLYHQNAQGYLVVHIVDRDNFDPVVPPSAPFYFVNPQTFAKNRITTSSVIFENFKYSSKFDYQPTDNKSTYVEKFHNLNNGKIFRKNEHTFYMESEEDILTMAKNEGFVVHAKIDLLNASYEYQYLYVFATSS